MAFRYDDSSYILFGSAAAAGWQFGVVEKVHLHLITILLRLLLPPPTAPPSSLLLQCRTARRVSAAELNGNDQGGNYIATDGSEEWIIM